MRTLLLITILLAVLLGISFLRIRELEYIASVRLPPCQEDATLIGWGQFEAGYWQYYTCGPSVDDYDQ